MWITFFSSVISDDITTLHPHNNFDSTFPTNLENTFSPNLKNQNIPTTYNSPLFKKTSGHFSNSAESLLPSLATIDESLKRLGQDVTLLGSSHATVSSHHSAMTANLSATEPFCQIYTGQTCSEYLSEKYVFVQPPFSQKNIEEKITSAFLVISHSK